MSAAARSEGTPYPRFAEQGHWSRAVTAVQRVALHHPAAGSGDKPIQGKVSHAAVGHAGDEAQLQPRGATDALHSAGRAVLQLRRKACRNPMLEMRSFVLHPL